MSDCEPIIFRPRSAGVSRRPAGGLSPKSGETQQCTAFSRHELTAIMDVYGRKVARGEWRDYALDFLRDKAVFSVFRRSCEVPIYRIEKNPKLSRRQGAFAVISATGLVLKRGQDLNRVLSVLEDRLELVSP